MERYSPAKDVLELLIEEAVSKDIKDMLVPVPVYGKAPRLSSRTNRGQMEVQGQRRDLNTMDDS